VRVGRGGRESHRAGVSTAVKSDNAFAGSASTATEERGGSLAFGIYSIVGNTHNRA